MQFTYYVTDRFSPNGVTEMFAATSNADAYGCFPVLHYFADNSRRWGVSSDIDIDLNWTGATPPAHRQAPS